MTDSGEPLSQAIARLSARGFTRDLRAVEGRLSDPSTGERYDPASLSIDEVVRFEGESDPDEQAILFALRSPGGGPLGTWAVVYGPGTPAEDAAVLQRLARRRAGA